MNSEETEVGGGGGGRLQHIATSFPTLSALLFIRNRAPGAIPLRPTTSSSFSSFSAQPHRPPAMVSSWSGQRGSPSYSTARRDSMRTIVCDLCCSHRSSNGHARHSFCSCVLHISAPRAGIKFDEDISFRTILKFSRKS